MDWTDFIFGKKALKNAAGQGGSPASSSSGSAGIDIAKMAQDQANNVKQNFTGPQSAYGQIKGMIPSHIPKMGQPGTAPQPTMQQLTGMGGQSATCPTCGGPIGNNTAGTQ